MLSFFPLDVLDEIWDVIESVSEGFLTYSFLPLPQQAIFVYVCTIVIYIICGLHAEARRGGGGGGRGGGRGGI